MDVSSVVCVDGRHCMFVLVDYPSLAVAQHSSALCYIVDEKKFMYCVRVYFGRGEGDSTNALQ